MREKICLNHESHDVVRPSPRPLLDKAIETARKMRSAAIAPVPITGFIRAAYGIACSPDDISTISPEFDEIQVQDADELIASFSAIGGVSETFTVSGPFNPARVAIFTATVEEQEDMSRFSDVILFDGTSLECGLPWDTFPIVLLDQSRQLASGGTLLSVCRRQMYLSGVPG